MGAKAGYPPPDLIKEVREEMLRLMTANVQAMAASCAEACIQQVWTACLTCLAAQASDEQESFPKFRVVDAAFREVPLEVSNSVASVAGANVLALPEILVPPPIATEFTEVATEERDDLLRKASALAAIRAEAPSFVLPEIADVQEAQSSAMAASAEDTALMLKTRSRGEEKMADAQIPYSCGRCGQEIFWKSAEQSSYCENCAVDNAVETPVALVELGRLAEVAVAEGALQSGVLAGLSDVSEGNADIEQEVEALRRVVASIAEQLATLNAEVDAAAKLAAPEGSGVETDGTRGDASLPEGTASAAVASIASRRYVSRLTSHQVDGGYVGYVGSSVEDLSGLFVERRRFEEWLDHAMRDAAVLLEQRDHFLRLASGQPLAVGHGECDSATKGVAAGGDFDVMRERGAAII